MSELEVVLPKACPRCGGEHVGLVGRVLKKWSEPAPGIIFANWTTCPTTQEPILLGMSKTQREAHKHMLELSLAS